MTTSNSDPSTISVLLIDGNERDRTHYAEQLKRSSSDYEILEAADGQTALDLCRSRRIDCVILELDLPDQFAFRILVQLVPMTSRPKVAVIILTHKADPRVRGLALKNGAYDYFIKSCTAVDDLDRAIRRAVALVELLPKEGCCQSLPVETPI